MKKIMILVGGLIAVMSFVVFCFGEDKITIVDSVRNAKSISELRSYLGIDDEHKSIKRAILERLDQFEGEEDENEKVEILYLLYMQEETEENDKIECIGGEGPRHIYIQKGVLHRLAKSPLIDKGKRRVLVKEIPLEKSKKRILDIVDRYLTSVNEMDYQKWRLSPKQSLTISIACLLGSHIEDKEIREMAYRYLASNNIKEKEYPMPYLEIPLLEYRLSNVSKKEDVGGTKRIKMVLDVATKPELRDMLRCPKRLYRCAEVLGKVLENDLTKLDAFMKSNPELGQPTKYFLHFFIIRSLSKNQKGSLNLSIKETNRLKESVEFWAGIYPTIIIKEKYGGDVLGEAINTIAEKIDDKVLKKKIENCKQRTIGGP